MEFEVSRSAFSSSTSITKRWMGIIWFGINHNVLLHILPKDIKKRNNHPPARCFAETQKQKEIPEIRKMLRKGIVSVMFSSVACTEELVQECFKTIL